jgi:DNA-directed RNA polymerase subunit RPC12/RpoP
MLEKRAFHLDPFILPVCSTCGGAMNLSWAAPALLDDEHELRGYRCTGCGEEHACRMHRPRSSTR